VERLGLVYPKKKRYLQQRGAADPRKGEQDSVAEGHAHVTKGKEGKKANGRRKRE